ncbi:MAG: hypothetical protein Q9224_005608 [Gallowayella concinna]
MSASRMESEAAADPETKPGEAAKESQAPSALRFPPEEEAQFQYIKVSCHAHRGIDVLQQLKLNKE